MSCRVAGTRSRHDMECLLLLLLLLFILLYGLFRMNYDVVLSNML